VGVDTWSVVCTKLSELHDNERRPATGSSAAAGVWAKARQRSPIPGAGPDLGERYELRWVDGSRAEVLGRGGPR